MKKIIRFAILILIAFCLTVPSHAQMAREMDDVTFPKEKFEASPNVPRPILTEEQVLKEIEKFRSHLKTSPPQSEADLRKNFQELGSNLGLFTDVITIAGAGEAAGWIGKTQEGLGNLGLCITVATLMDKAFVQGEHIGLDVGWEATKFLVEKGAGGPVSAGLGILKYQLDTIGNAALKQIDTDFYRAYVNFHLSDDKTAAHIWKLYAQENADAKVQQALDSFWDDPVCHGIRGWYTLKVQYDKNPGDAGLYKKAYRERFLNEYIYPALYDEVQRRVIDAEMDLIYTMSLEEKGLLKRQVKVVVPNIVDAGRFAPTKDLVAHLVHSDKYIIATRPVTNRGVEFIFPEGKMIDPEKKEPARAFELYLVPSGEAKFPGPTQYRRHHLNIDSRFSRVRQDWRSTETTYVFNKSIRQPLAYPVTVRIEGDGLPITTVWTKTGPSSVSSGSIEGMTIRAKQTSEGVYIFQKMPSGTRVISSDAGRLGKPFIVKATPLTYKRPPTPAMHEATNLPTVPDFRQDLAEVQTKLDELADLEGNRPREDILPEAEKLIQELSLNWSEWEANYYRIEKELQARRTLISSSNLPDKERKDRLEVIRAKTQELYALRNQAFEARDMLGKRIYDYYKQTEQKVRDETSAIEDEYRAAEQELTELLSEGDRFSREISGGARNMFYERQKDGLRYRTESEAEEKISGFQQEAEANVERYEAFQSLMEKIDAAYARFQAALERKEALAVYNDGSLPVPRHMYFLANRESLERKADAIKKGDLRRATDLSMRDIRHRHDVRKKNAQELARIVEAIAGYKDKIPEVDPNLFSQTLDEFKERFDTTLTDEKADFRPLLSALSQFLDQQEAILGDLRPGGASGTTIFSELGDLSRQMRAMTRSRTAYVDRNAIRSLKPVWQKRAPGRQVRQTTGTALIAMESDLKKAAANPTGYRDALPVNQKNVADHIKNAENTADIGTALEEFQKAWEACEALPRHWGTFLREQIGIKATERCEGDTLEKYAQHSNRPLVLFESFEYSHLRGDDRKVNPVGTALVQIDPPPDGRKPYSVTFKARIVGLPEGFPAYIETATPTYSRQVYCKPAGTVYVSANSSTKHPHVQVLGSGATHRPIDYPFLHQVTLKSE
ncbi:hypothetical protein D3OALGA1CA_3376 [Olavius algarvensis associated proteobacterium Delta 3]|nr:hypothetical protein D3OALGA1CA_3376 [Olavius algarvensis associated proteobacterium Delta 3]